MKIEKEAHRISVEQRVEGEGEKRDGEDEHLMTVPAGNTNDQLVIVSGADHGDRADNQRSLQREGEQSEAKAERAPLRSTETKVAEYVELVLLIAQTALTDPAISCVEPRLFRDVLIQCVVVSPVSGTRQRREARQRPIGHLKDPRGTRCLIAHAVHTVLCAVKVDLHCVQLAEKEGMFERGGRHSVRNPVARPATRSLCVAQDATFGLVGPRKVRMHAQQLLIQLVLRRRNRERFAHFVCVARMRLPRKVRIVDMHSIPVENKRDATG